MKKLILLLYFLSMLIQAQSSIRYLDSSFTAFQSFTNETYAIADELNFPYVGESFTHPQELKFNLYEPISDTLAKRPLIVFVHGGAFISGNKEHDDMTEFCKTFAEKGYVTATIQYRLGMNILSSISGERSVYRGLQDGRAAIRYFKENASTYRIDTNHIYFVGSSAGAFIGLHNLFMNEEAERPAGSYLISNFPPTSNDGPNLGSLDAIIPALKHNSHPNGVVSLWGAVKDTLLIKEDDTDIPLLLIHGTNDLIVPFEVGSPFNAPSLPPTYGSKPITDRFNTFGKNLETYFVHGEGHEFYGVLNGMWNPEPNAYWDEVVTRVKVFLNNIHKPTAQFTFESYKDTVRFTDNSNDAIKWFWDFGDSTTSTLQNPEHVYKTAGEYKVTLTIHNSIESQDSTSMIVDVTLTGIGNKKNVTANYSLSQNYPNPFNPTTNIKYSIQQNGNVTLKIYNILGKEIRTIVNKNQPAGNYSVKFDASSLSSGIYFYTLSSKNFRETKKMILLR